MAEFRRGEEALKLSRIGSGGDIRLLMSSFFTSSLLEAVVVGAECCTAGRDVDAIAIGTVFVGLG